MELEQNHGVLQETILPEQYIFGGETTIELTGRVKDWSLYLPKDERQSVSGVYDTMACTHFASGHIIETQIIYLWDQLPYDAKNFFSQFLKDPNDIRSFRVSKQFSAIVGNNTPNGNFFTAAWDSWRKVGMIPDSMLNTLHTSKNWHEYHDKAHVTKAMMDMAAESLKYIDINYQWLPVDSLIGFSVGDRAIISQTLQTAPINGGIPIPANHSVEIFSLEEKYGGAFYGLFNTYDPFTSHVSENNPPVQFAMQGVVTLKKPVVVTPFTYTFTKQLTYNTSSNDPSEVHKLQQALQFLKDKKGNPYMKAGLFGVFGTNTKLALGKFQSDNGISDPNGQGTNFGPRTRAIINQLLNHAI